MKANMATYRFFVFNKKRSITTNVSAENPEDAVKQAAHLFDKRSKVFAVSLDYSVSRPEVAQKLADSINKNNALLQKLKGMKV